MYGWKGKAVFSTVLFNEPFQMCCHPVDLSNHIRRAVRCNGNELVKSRFSFLELFKNEASHFFPRRNSTQAYEDGNFQSSVVK